LMQVEGQIKRSATKRDGARIETIHQDFADTRKADGMCQIFQRLTLAIARKFGPASVLQLTRISRLWVAELREKIPIVGASEHLIAEAL